MHLIKILDNGIPRMLPIWLECLDSMIFSIKQKFTKKIYKFKIKKNHLVSYQSPSKKKFEIQFPFSKITSGIFLKNCEKKNFKYMPSFDDDYKLSTFFLKKFKVKIP